MFSFSHRNQFSSVQQFVQHEPVQKDFTYKISNKNFCRFNNSPDVLIFVLSKSKSFESRQAIRRTWGNVDLINSLPSSENITIKLLFLVDIDESLLMKIQMEETLFNDLVQVELPQHYSLSSYRDVAILHWTETFCPNVQLTMKTDDDVFLNIFLLVNVLKTLVDKSVKINSTESRCNETKFNDRTAMMFGVRIQDALVVRSNFDSSPATARYIVTDDEFPCEFYPNYLSGFGYLINAEARRNLLCIFFRSETFFPLSDVYLTGILGEYLGIRRRALALRIASRAEDDCRTFFKDPAAFACVSSSHHSSKENVDIFDIFNSYWTVINDHFDSYKTRVVIRP